MAKNEAILLCGLPRAGKSTAAGHLMEDYDLHPSMEHVWAGLKLITGLSERDLRKQGVEHWLGDSPALEHIFSSGFNPPNVEMPSAIVVDDITSIWQFNSVVETLFARDYSYKVFWVDNDFVNYRSKDDTAAAEFRAWARANEIPFINNYDDFQELAEQTRKVMEENNVSLQ